MRHQCALPVPRTSSPSSRDLRGNGERQAVVAVEANAACHELVLSKGQTQTQAQAQLQLQPSNAPLVDDA